MIARPALGVAALSCALALASGPAHAFVREASNWNPATLPVPYGINLSTSPSSLGMSGVMSTVEAGMASWAGPSCTAYRTTFTGNTTRTANTSDMLNTILWISGTWPAELGDEHSTIGITTPVWETPGYFIDADIQFNNVGFTWNMTGASGTVDAQSIETHEEGHYAGLGHSPISTAIMYASYSGGIKRTLDPDDVSGICTIYPSGAAIPDSGTTPPADSGTTTPPGGTTGAPCGSPADCTSGLCVTETMSDGTMLSFCSAMCTADCGCPTGYSCVATEEGDEVCAPGTNTCSTPPPPEDAGPTTGSGATGAPCTTGSDCGDGLCVHEGTMAGFCSQLCNTDCQCPAGFQCYPTSSSGVMACGAGTNSCVGGSDGGITTVDSGLSTTDAATSGDTGATGDASHSAGNPGCACALLGSRSRATDGGCAWLALGAALIVVRRRRRCD